MPIGSNATTANLPRKAEKGFLVAPQAAFGTPTYTGAQPLHFTEFNPDRQQEAQVAREYGGATVGSAIDPGDSDFGDVSVSAPLQTNLCLNEIGFLLAYALGAPVSTDLGGGKYRHVFASGKGALPLATVIETDRDGGRVLDSLAIGSLALAIAQGGGKQLVDFTTIARELVRASTADIDAATNAQAEVSRLFVPKSAFTATLDGTAIGRLLSANLNYSADLQTDRYVSGNAGVDETIGDLYVGDPTASLAVTLRHVGESQRALFDAKDVPKALAVRGVAPGGHSIEISLPRCFIPPVHPTADDRLQQLSFTATAARDGVSAVRVTLENAVAGY